MTGIGRRLDQLEEYFVDPTQTPDAIAQRAYHQAWTEAAEAMLLTMSIDHRQLIVDAWDALDTDDRPPDSLSRRLWRAFESRIVGRLGVGPAWGLSRPPNWPDSPPALPPVVAEAYLQDRSDDFSVSEGYVCADCHYMVPVTQRLMFAQRDQDGVWRWADGERVASPGVPVYLTPTRMWRTLNAIEPCPLCGGPIVKPANWYDGIGVMRRN